MKDKFVAKLFILTSLVFFVKNTYSAISIDRTRIIYNEDYKSVSIRITNENLEYPYLAQSWIENEEGEKVNFPFIVIPPVQRIEANSRSQIKIQATSLVKQLPQDRESIFYFNIREIPPRSNKENVLQITLQTKIKLFYRPKSIFIKDRLESIPQENDIKIIKQGTDYFIKNPLPYFLNITKLAQGNKEIKNFEPITIAPFSEIKLNGAYGNINSSPTISYINDFGGTVDLNFTCINNECSSIKK